MPERIKSLFSAQHSWHNFNAQKLLDDPNLLQTFIKFFRWGTQDLKYANSSKILASLLNKLHNNRWSAEEKIKSQQKILEAFCAPDAEYNKGFPFTTALMDEVAHFECSAVLPFVKIIAQDKRARRVVWDMALTRGSAEFQENLLDAVAEKSTATKATNWHASGDSFEGIRPEILFAEDRVYKLIRAGFFTAFIDLVLNSADERYLNCFSKDLKTFFNKKHLNAKEFRAFHYEALEFILEKGKQLNLISEKDYKHTKVL